MTPGRSEIQHFERSDAINNVRFLPGTATYVLGQGVIIDQSVSQKCSQWTTVPSKVPLRSVEYRVQGIDPSSPPLPPSLPPDVLSGYNATIFAYGQTSSGKTHTMEVRSHGSGREAPGNRAVIKFTPSCFLSNYL